MKRYVKESDHSGLNCHWEPPPTPPYLRGEGVTRGPLHRRVWCPLLDRRVGFGRRVVLYSVPTWRPDRYSGFVSRYGPSGPNRSGTGVGLVESLTGVPYGLDRHRTLTRRTRSPGFLPVIVEVPVFILGPKDGRSGRGRHSLGPKEGLLGS